MNESSGQKNPVISVENVSKAFERPVLKNVSLCIDSPQSVFVCGINGAGKSTLLKLLAGLLQPDAGSVRILGRCLRSDTEQVKAALGIIMHQSMVYSDLTVTENLDFFARLYGLSHRQACIDSMLERVGLAAFRYDKAGVLSRGLLQRLSIARAMIHNPHVMLADEPFTGLDAVSSGYLSEMLKQFRQGGGTIILTTHDVMQGLRCAERVVVIDEGAIVFDRQVSRIDPVRFAQDYLQYSRESA